MAESVFFLIKLKVFGYVGTFLSSEYITNESLFTSSCIRLLSNKSRAIAQETTKQKIKRNRAKTVEKFMHDSVKKIGFKDLDFAS